MIRFCLQKKWMPLSSLYYFFHVVTNGLKQKPQPQL